MTGTDMNFVSGGCCHSGGSGVGDIRYLPDLRFYSKLPKMHLYRKQKENIKTVQSKANTFLNSLLKVDRCFKIMFPLQ